jgi:hypothetical protein
VGDGGRLHPAADAELAEDVGADVAGLAGRAPLGQVPPGRAGPGPPDDPVDHLPIVTPGASLQCGQVRQIVADGGNHLGDVGGAGAHVAAQRRRGAARRALPMPGSPAAPPAAATGGVQAGGEHRQLGLSADKELVNALVMLCQVRSAP